MLENKKIGFCMTGSFCTFQKVIPQIKKLVEAGADVLPIMSFNSYELDTKFGDADSFIKQIEAITSHSIIHSIEDAEPIGPKGLTDLMVIVPCTGNTLAKLSAGITDTPVLMATKSHLRNGNNVVVGISTNDGLAGSASNIGTLLNRKHYYFVPFRQDNPITKPCSLVFDPNFIIPTIDSVLENKQIQPILL